ncbi:distal tail protein Dit [Heyndrickxia sporothermodurans]|uniref:distal tail protein Dit n=1 Tax=Heyndrickxia sporothermodurans TaxID=46224 RepID=UPI002E233407|nr:distal tail protein Dit [Heyndrickxia sporothermodurans]MED3650604.1 phage tail family protein [Heyndrickxia sporothermodurans]MED3697368.1 phage tail family protein [Heyndrickxia sporothermodurans]
MSTFNFCGVDSLTDLDIIVNEIKKPVTPEITENVQDVPGMLGKIYMGNSYGQKVFEILITIKAKSEQERVQKIDQLTELVMTFGDGEYPMIFSTESDYTYYGHFSGITTPERVEKTHWATCTLTFSCSDPRGYGEYESNDMTQNPITILPNGKADCFPIFTCLPKKDVTKIAITDEDGNYVYIGADVNPDTGDAPIDKEPLVLHDPCNTLATWTEITKANLTFEIENGIPSGRMRSTANAIKVALDSNKVSGFGPATNNKKWHGPIRQQWLPNAYDDFRIRVRMWNRQYYARSRGKCEVYLLDANGTRFGKFMLKDNGNSEEVYAQIQLGTSTDYHNIYYGKGKIKKGKTKTKTIKVKNGTKKVKSKGKTKTVQQWKTVKLDEDTTSSTFTDFYGYLELRKVGNKYRAEIMKFDDDSNPAWDKPIVVNWTDSKGKYAKKLAGIAFYTAKMDITEDAANPVKRYTNNGMALSDVKVWNIIDGGNKSSSSPTVIAHKGDEIKLNCEDRTIYKNGAVFMKNFYIGSEFPTMQGGIQKTFAFEPGLDEADWYLEYRPTKN